MLEIFFLIWFAKKLSATATAKGRSGGWAALGVCLWIGGELTGFIIGGVLRLGSGSYLTAILSAVVGAVIAWIVVSNLGDASPRTIEQHVLPRSQSISPVAGPSPIDMPPPPGSISQG